MLFGESLCQHSFNVNFCAKPTSLVEIFLLVRRVNFRASMSNCTVSGAPSNSVEITVDRSSENGEVEGGMGCHRGPKRSRQEAAESKDRSNACHEKDS